MKIVKPMYKVQVENEPVMCFENKNAAVDYATRQVFMPTATWQKVHTELSEGRTVSYTYGFNSVTIEATAPEEPYNKIIKHAPELFEALKKISDLDIHDDKQTFRAIARDAIARVKYND